MALSSEFSSDPSESVVKVLSLASRDGLGLIDDGLDLGLGGGVLFLFEGGLDGGEGESGVEREVTLTLGVLNVEFDLGGREGAVGPFEESYFAALGIH